MIPHLLLDLVRSTDNEYIFHLLQHSTVVHELGHAIGFFHEQSRTDRDSYVSIHLQNVKEGTQFNFQK